MYYLEIAANATTQVKVGSGTLASIIITNAGTSWNFRILDGTANGSSVNSGYGAIAGGTKVAVPAAGTPLYFNCGFSQGLVIVTSDGSPGSLTVTYA